MRKNINWQKNSLRALDFNIANMERDSQALLERIARARKERDRLSESIMMQEAASYPVKPAVSKAPIPAFMLAALQ